MVEPTYTYWLVYITEEYQDKIGCQGTSPANRSLYAYSDKKKFVDEFLKYRIKKAFYVNKVELTKEGVHDLAKNFQNNVIKKTEIPTRDSDYRPVTVTLYMTESEYMIAEQRCYNMSDSLWVCVWGTKYDLLKTRYKKALDLLGFHYLHKLLNRGDSYKVLLNNYMETDTLGSFIATFHEILNGELR